MKLNTRDSYKKIMLIDDNEIFRMIFTNMLKNIPDSLIEVNTFENALDGLEYFEANKNNIDSLPDYLFVDINMPYMTGWQMMDELVNNNFDELQKKNIFILSSSMSSNDMDQLKKYPFIKSYINKPIDSESLHKLIREN